MHGTVGLLTFALVYTGHGICYNLTLSGLRRSHDAIAAPLIAVSPTSLASRLRLVNSMFMDFIASALSGDIRDLHASFCLFSGFKAPVLAAQETDYVYGETINAKVISADIKFERCLFTRSSAAYATIVCTKLAKITTDLCLFEDNDCPTGAVITGAAEISLSGTRFTNCHYETFVSSALTMDAISINGCNTSESSMQWVLMTKTAMFKSFTSTNNRYTFYNLVITAPSVTMCGVWFYANTISTSLRFDIRLEASTAALDQLHLATAASCPADINAYHIYTSTPETTISNSCFSFPRERWILGDAVIDQQTTLGTCIIADDSTLTSFHVIGTQHAVFRVPKS